MFLTVFFAIFPMRVAPWRVVFPRMPRVLLRRRLLSEFELRFDAAATLPVMMEPGDPLTLVIHCSLTQPTSTSATAQLQSQGSVARRRIWSHARGPVVGITLATAALGAQAAREAMAGLFITATFVTIPISTTVARWPPGIMECQ
jgi:hypothetical protein